LDSTTNISLRVGLWEQEIGVYLLDRHIAILVQLGVLSSPALSTGLVLYDDIRTVSLGQTYSSQAIIEPASDLDLWPWFMRFDVCSEKIARCRIMKLPFVSLANTLVAELPPDHELPWPRLEKCSLYNRNIVARREIQKRVSSARDNNVRFRLSNIPSWAQKCLTSKERISIHMGKEI